jgi:response regulator RpfG family c-di-GMP phosphodiesterase
LALFRQLPIPAAGLVGTEIPLFARIVAIADVFDALSGRRSYKDPWPEARVLPTIRDESGRAFDPERVEIFVERFEWVKVAWARYPDQAHGA